MISYDECHINSLQNPCPNFQASEYPSGYSNRNAEEIEENGEESEQKSLVQVSSIPNKFSSNCIILMLCCIILYYITLYHIIYYIISYYIILYYVILRYIILYHITLYYIILHYIILYYTTQICYILLLCCVASFPLYYVIFCYIMQYFVVYHFIIIHFRITCISFRYLF